MRNSLEKELLSNCSQKKRISDPDAQPGRARSSAVHRRSSVTALHRTSSGLPSACSVPVQTDLVPGPHKPCVEKSNKPIETGFRKIVRHPLISTGRAGSSDAILQKRSWKGKGQGEEQKELVGFSSFQPFRCSRHPSLASRSPANGALSINAQSYQQSDEQDASSCWKSEEIKVTMQSLRNNKVAVNSVEKLQLHGNHLGGESEPSEATSKAVIVKCIKGPVDTDDSPATSSVGHQPVAIKQNEVIHNTMATTAILSDELTVLTGR